MYLIYEKDLSLIEVTSTSNGVLTKWYDERNKLFIKTSSKITDDKYHIESYMECIAYEIGKLLGVNLVEYWLDTLKIKDKIIDVCVSKDYRVRLGVTSVLTAKELLIKNNVTSRSQRYKTLTTYYPDTKTEIDKMIVFDYLIANYDRHMRNIEFYRTSNGKILMSPLFDNGSSLLADWSTEEDLDDLLNSEELYEENIINSSTPSKCFTHEHSTEIMLVNKSVLSQLNFNIGEEDIKKILNRYSKFISNNRVELITKLLLTRLSKLKKLSNTESRPSWDNFFNT